MTATKNRKRKAPITLVNASDSDWSGKVVTCCRYRKYLVACSGGRTEGKQTTMYVSVCSVRSNSRCQGSRRRDTVSLGTRLRHGVLAADDGELSRNPRL